MLEETALVWQDITGVYIGHLRPHVFVFSDPTNLSFYYYNTSTRTVFHRVYTNPERFNMECERINNVMYCAA